jgi:hypothetical protein
VGDFFANFIVDLCRGLAELVNAAMDIGVLGFVVFIGGFDDGFWFLGGGAVVEIDERMVVGAGGEDGEDGLIFGMLAMRVMGSDRCLRNARPSGPPLNRVWEFGYRAPLF